MTYNDLITLVELPYFNTYQIYRLFPGEKSGTIKKQLVRFVQNGQLTRIKRGLYLFADRKIDDLELAKIIYQPSYISLETALNLHGVLPDIPASITSITTVTPNAFSTERGIFSYSRIRKDLYFGYQTIPGKNGLSYDLADPEKALLDLIYIRKLRNLMEMRVDFENINKKKLLMHGSYYPTWVNKALGL